MYDLLFREGQVVDGTGSPPFPADVAILGDTIAAVGPLHDVEARTVIDCSGHMVAPGFVDMHAHSDLALLKQPTAEPKVMQGVVTEVIGQDGLSYAPVTDSTLPAIQSQIAGWNGSADGVDFAWRDVAGYLARLDGTTSVNVAFLVPHGNVRMAVMGSEERAASQDELSAMRELVRRGLEQGAVGLSTGLSYTPASYADSDELVALCEELVPFGGFFAPHTRSYGRGVMEAYEEMFSVCERAAAALHLTHCQVSFPGNEGRATDLVDRIRAAPDAVDLTADSYPYVAGSTYLAAFLPNWAWHNGPEGVLATLQEADAAERIRHELEDVGTTGFHGALMDWSKIQIGSVGSQANAGCAGKTIAQLADEHGVTGWDEARRLMIEEALNVNVLTFVGHEENIETIMRLPEHMAGSDGIMVGDHPHPRAWGTFARYLAYYTRERGFFSWGEIVRKMSSMPHRRLGQYDRGVIRRGLKADVVVFHPEEVRDTADYERPRSYPTGIPHVAVNGVLVKHGGRHTGRTPGRVLRAAGRAA